MTFYNPELDAEIKKYLEMLDNYELQHPSNALNTSHTESREPSDRRASNIEMTDSKQL